MKFSRKMATLGLALVMVAAMGVTAIAASTSNDSTVAKIKSGVQGMFGGFRGGSPDQSLDVVATLTGLTADEIQTQIKAGKTLAEIAATKNVSQDALIAALVKDAQAKLDTAKANRKITQEQYDQRVANLKDRITKQVTATRPQGRGGWLGYPEKSMDVVTALTGLTVDEIQTQIKAGKTLVEIAASKSVSQDTLVAALVKDAQTKLDTAKADGKITQAQYDQCVTDLKDRITNQVTETRPLGKGGMRGDKANSLEVVATLTGLTVDEIQTQLHAGKTMAAIAAAKNISQDALVTALVKDAQAKLDTAKADGKITQAQYDQCVTDLKERIARQVTETRPKPPAGMGMRGEGPGMGHRMGPNHKPATNAAIAN